MNDEEKRELQERVHQLRELSNHPGWAVLVDFVFFGPGGSQTHQRQLVNGVKAWDDYLMAVGFIKGVHFVTEAPSRVERQLEAVMED